ncbi:MAG: hypothetical protein AAGF98_01290 [Cyanobacteria bacterium P01_H01_bin.153]
MSSPFPTCPACHSPNVVKNGRIHNGKQNHKCQNCGRQFVQDPQNKIIDEATKHLIDKLLLEKIPLAGIARVAEVSEVWLQQYVNTKYQQVERQVRVSPQKKGA